MRRAKIVPGGDERIVDLEHARVKSNSGGEIFRLVSCLVSRPDGECAFVVELDTEMCVGCALTGK